MNELKLLKGKIFHFIGIGGISMSALALILKRNKIFLNLPPHLKAPLLPEGGEFCGGIHFNFPPSLRLLRLQYYFRF